MNATHTESLSVLHAPDSATVPDTRDQPSKKALWGFTTGTSGATISRTREQNSSNARATDVNVPGAGFP